jgi:hypothetical protein
MKGLRAFGSVFKYGLNPTSTLRSPLFGNTWCTTQSPFYTNRFFATLSKRELELQKQYEQPPELVGEPMPLDSETLEQIEYMKKQQHPFVDPDDPAAAHRRFYTALMAPTASSKVIKLLDYQLQDYSLEEYFGITTQELEQLTQSHNKQSNAPRIKTLEPFTKRGFDQLITLQARNNLPDKALHTLSVMQVNQDRKFYFNPIKTDS